MPDLPSDAEALLAVGESRGPRELVGAGTDSLNRAPRSASVPDGVIRPLSAPWWWLAVAAAILAAAAGVTGLLAASHVYSHETRQLVDAATAQDVVTLLPAAPLLALLALRARRGSVCALLALPGVLAFAVYNYAIYAFSIHFGPLFLVWVAVLGLSVFALLGILATADTVAIKQRFAGPVPSGTARFLIGVALLFVALWLKEILPDLLGGRLSTSATKWNLPTNPVHVLDLAFFLPATITTGILLLRRHPVGYATAPAQLIWLALTCLPILITPLIATARDHTPNWSVVPAIGALLLATLAVLWRLLQHTLAPLDRRRAGTDGREPP